MKFRFSAALMAAAMLAGCTSTPAADTDSADPAAEEQVEKFNQIQNLIDNHEEEEAFTEMFQATLSAYSYKIEEDNISQGSFIEIDDGKLATDSANRTTDTVTFQQDGTLYIITETADDDLGIVIYNDEGGKSAGFDLEENGEAILESIGGGSKDVKSADERQQDLLANIFKDNSAIAFNPVDNPDYYEFTSSDTGTGMVISIDILDLDKFNEEAKNTFADGWSVDGQKVDSAQVKMNYFDVNINNEGVINQVTHVVEIEYTMGDQKKTEKYEVTTNIYSYDYDKFNTDEITKIFAGIDDGTLKAGDSVQLTRTEK